MSLLSTRTLLTLGACAAFTFAPAAIAQNEPPKNVDPPVKTDAPASDLPKAEEILDRYVEVTGGKKAYEEIKSIVLSATLKMPMDMQGSMKIYIKRPNKMLSEMNLDGIGEIRSGSDGDTVWSDNPMQGPRILEGMEREMTLEGARIGEEANWRDRYTKVETIGNADVAGKPAYKVNMVSKDGSKRVGFYDKESGLLVKQEITIDSEMGQMPMSIAISDYRKVGGILIPHKTTTEVMTQEMTSTFDKVDINADIPDSKFELPKEIKELVEAKKKSDTPEAPSTPKPADDKK